MNPAPLEGTRQRIAQTFRGFTFDLDHDHERWISVAAATAPDRLASRVEHLTRRYGGQRDVAAAYLAMRVAAVVAGPLVGPYLLERRVPLVEPPITWLRTHPQLEFDRLAAGTSHFAALADDPDAGHPDVTVVDADELTAVIVGAFAELLGPLLDNLRVVAPFGRRGMWGLVADSIGGCALAAARETGTDHRPAWTAANDILDRLRARGLPIGNRPRPLVATCGGREFPFNIRGTCCLRYKAGEPPAHHDPDFGAYCHSCPLVDDDTLQRHYLDNARERLQGESV
ncbi:(2Fe-2S)-binding protein [Desertimonas flava]|uniref:(2Fe-2S)-binding protein n=1 Tax=Desertimonas flava TaxID=2064846 RepID=UPI000E349FC4|nr:(2Fe-2S)-binding protein [Desertimonas flava]